MPCSAFDNTRPALLCHVASVPIHVRRWPLNVSQCRRFALAVMQCLTLCPGIPRRTTSALSDRQSRVLRGTHDDVRAGSRVMCSLATSFSCHPDGSMAYRLSSAPRDRRSGSKLGSAKVAQRRGSTKCLYIVAIRPTRGRHDTGQSDNERLLDFCHRLTRPASFGPAPARGGTLGTAPIVACSPQVCSLFSLLELAIRLLPLLPCRGVKMDRTA